MSTPTLDPFAPRSKNVYGRSEEMQAIRKALFDSGDAGCALYFWGPGGMGKTRLLEEAMAIAKKEGGAGILTLEIVDLYNTAMHSAEGVQRALAGGLGLAEGSRYQQAQQEVDEALNKGLQEGLDEKRRQATAAFVADYQRIAGGKRILLRFDTLELLQQKDSDLVVEVRGAEEAETAEVQEWLLTVLPTLPNTVALLAARPPAPLRDALRQRYQDAGLHFADYELTRLDEAAMEDYLKELADQRPELLQEISEETRRSICAQTGGRPIRLSLMVDLVLNGQEVADLLNLVPGEQADAEGIDRRLIERLLDRGDPESRTGRLVHHLALARKGLSPELLQFLEPGWTESDIQAAVNRMRRFSFVKSPPGTDILFLHDEVAEMYERFEFKGYPPGTQWGLIASYYSDLLKNASEPDVRKRLQVERLHYALRADPWRTFWEDYVPLVEAAAKANDADLDVQLRDELRAYMRWAREFGDTRLSQEIVDHDAAVRWIRRYLSRSDFPRAVAVGKRILSHTNATFQSDDPLYRGALLTNYAEALAYVGDTAEAEVRTHLEEAIFTLEGWMPESAADPRIWWRDRMLGRAYNNLGYLHWLQGRLGTAAQELREAISRFRQTDIQDDHADSLNNLGFVYAQQGNNDSAESALKDGIDLRQRLGLEYALALSYNTLGLAHVYAGSPRRGAKWCQQALEIFNRLEREKSRGQGLARLALGLAYRKQAEEWKSGEYTPEEAEERFEWAIQELTLAREIFSPGNVDEPLRLWEAYSELGSTYCDWGWLLMQKARKAHDDAERQAFKMQSGEKYDRARDMLAESVKVAENHGLTLQLADSYDDLSQVYHDRCGLEEQDDAHCATAGDQYLQFIEAMVPPDYRLLPDGGGFRKIEYPIEKWWVVLGKIYLGRAVRLMREAVDKGLDLPDDEKDKLLREATEQYAYALAYFQKFSPDSPDLRMTIKSIHRRLKTVNAERLVWLRKQLADFADEHNLDFNPLLKLLDDTLGLEPLQSLTHPLDS